MRIWRISNHADLSGAGGKYAAGRWNHLGTPIVYCADHPALAMLEILVHVDAEDLPENYRLLEIDAPDGTGTQDADLPQGWSSDVEVTRDIFERFRKRAERPILRVPSIIMPRCYNLLLNPEHRDHSELAIISSDMHPLDPRFLR